MSRKIKIELHWQILIAMVLAAVVGVMFRDYVPYISWMGDLFLRALKMVVIPLIIGSVISAIVNIGGGSNFGRLGRKTILYYLATSLIAIIISLVLMNIFRPGDGFKQGQPTIESASTEVSTSTAESVSTAEVLPEFKDVSLGDTVMEIVPNNIFESLANGDYLSIIFFSIIIGVFAIKMKSDKDISLIKDASNGIFNLFMDITMFVVSLAPWGVFGLIAKFVADQDPVNFMVNIKSLLIFSLVVIGGLILHGFIVLPIAMKLIGRVSPWQHLSNMKRMMLTAFTTASSAAALPINMKDTSELSGVPTKITGFTLPIGATVNMDGTAIYMCSVVLFIAQVRGVEVGLNQQFIIVITALMASIGTAAIPMGSLVIIGILLKTLDLPYELIGLVLPVDRILDMFRTSINVWSDSCGAVLIAKSEGEKLPIDL